MGNETNKDSWGQMKAIVCQLKTKEELAAAFKVLSDLAFPRLSMKAGPDGLLHFAPRLSAQK